MGNNIQEATIISKEKILLPWTVGLYQNIGSRKEQQDSFGKIYSIFHEKPVLLAILADGMGGMKDGAQFSRITVNTHLEKFHSVVEKYENPVNVLLTLAHESNLEANKIYNPDKPGGTTLISAIFYKNYMTFLSIGDSRINLVRNGKALQLNREHVFGSVLDERAWMGVIPHEDAEGSILRDRLISSVGEPKIRRLDIIENPIELLPGDRIVMMSDGVYRALTDEEIISDFCESPQETAEKIISHVAEKAIKDQDNNTILIVEKE